MAGSSRRNRRPFDGKEKVIKVNEEIPSAGNMASSAAAEVEDDGLCYLSGDKPFFDIILTKSHVSSPYNTTIPAHAIHILPYSRVRTVLIHGGKEWHMMYIGNMKRPRFEPSTWRTFVADNNLKCEDACIFEVLESSDEMVMLRVVILRNSAALPPELLADIESQGTTKEKPIEID